MSEESGEQGGIITEPSRPQDPTFQGRLQLNDFIFKGATHSPPGTRRSPRLLLSQSSRAASSSGSPTPAPKSGTTSDGASPAPRSAPKRKSQVRRAIRSPSSQSTSKDDDEARGSPSPRKKRNRMSSSYAPPSAYAHLSPLVDVLAPNLLILFVGLNPGVQTARMGHAYAHPSNLFWKLLYSSGITPVPCRPEEDRTLPERFSLGNTNIVSRPSRNGAELSKAEMDAGVAVLEEKARRWRPEVVCIVGKSIWESIFRVWKGRNLAKGEFEYGWQAKRMGAVPAAQDSAAGRVGLDIRELLVKTQVLPNRNSEEAEDGSDANERLEGEREREREEKVDDGPWEGSRVFVATSTSGLAASLRHEEKERIWKVLGDWCVQRRKERADDKAGEI